MPSQVPTSARKPYFIFGDAQNSVDLWFFDLADPAPLRFTGRGSGDIAAADAADVTGVASYDQGEWSAIFKRPLRPATGAAFTARRVHAGGLLGVGRVLARAWQPAWSHALVLPLRRAGRGAIGSGPMVKTALLILAIELAVIWLGAAPLRLRRPWGGRPAAVAQRLRRGFVHAIAR